MSWSARAFGLNHEQMQFLSWLSLIEQHDVLVQASEQQVKMAVSIWPGLRSRSSLKLFALFELFEGNSFFLQVFVGTEFSFEDFPFGQHQEEYSIQAA